MKCLLLGVFVAFSGFVWGNQTIAKGLEVSKLKVQIYYESLCPDCIQFFKKQLQKSMREKDRLPYTDLELVPFGFAKIEQDPATNDLVIRCQHGDKECKVNALHACVLENSEPEAAFYAISCMMSSYPPKVKMCAKKFHLNLEPIVKCCRDRTIPEILDKYGRETAAINPQSVPAVALDGIFKPDEQDQLTSEFDKMFCRAYKDKFGIQLEDCE
ncbi:unnamed protein product [Hermetia illucens]|uniref:Uncharacterized protein n=1 Tax=Hermetia illucens TaxID=343691 RepID=A0A7R8UP65_HERIL|nr:GILT-like protein 2 [Hermetia illucens]CAD7084356.1 unnamed protein product [Hermetia illucens]